MYDESITHIFITDRKYFVVDTCVRLSEVLFADWVEMGLCASKQKVYAFEVNPSKVGHEQDTYDLCHSFLELDDQGVDKFYQLFKKIDKDNTDTFTIEQFYKYIKVDRTNFTDRCFHFLGNREGVDFQAFILALWIFMTVRKQTFVRFAFSLYDTEETDRIKPDVVEEMYGPTWKANHNVYSVVQKMMDESGDGSLSLQMFEEMSKRNDKLLFPMFQMQLHLKERIFGAQFWDSEATRRNRLYGDIAGNLKKHLLKLVAKKQQGVGGARTDEHADESIHRENPEGLVLNDSKEKKEKKHKKDKKKKKHKKKKKKKKASKYGKTVSDSSSGEDDEEGEVW